MMDSLDYSLIKSKVSSTKEYTLLAPTSHLWTEYSNKYGLFKDVPMEIREILIHEFIKSKKSIKKLYSADMVMTKWRKLNGRIPSFINISGPKLNYDNLLTSEITLKAKSEK